MTGVLGALWRDWQKTADRKAVNRRPAPNRERAAAQ
jgi:hypothetical protein